MRIAAVAVGALVMCVGVARGDEAWDVVELINGRELRGSVVREGNEYLVRHRLGSIRVPANQVLLVRYEHDRVDEVERMRRAGYAQGTVDERFRYGEQLKRAGYFSESRRVLEGVAREDPAHAGANVALGRVLHLGEWMSPAERARQIQEAFERRQRALGLVLFDGDWVTPAERTRRIAQETARRKAEAAERARRAAEREQERALAAARAREAEQRLALTRAEAELAEARAAAARPVIVLPAPRPRNWNRGYGRNRGRDWNRNRNQGWSQNRNRGRGNDRNRSRRDRERETRVERRAPAPRPRTQPAPRPQPRPRGPVIAPPRGVLPAGVK